MRVETTKLKYLSLNKKFLFLFIPVFLTYSIFILGIGHSLHTVSFFRDTLKPLVKAPFQTIENIVAGLNVKSETLHIDVSHPNIEKLRHHRAVALNNGYLETKDDSYVRAHIRHSGSDYRTKIRLKIFFRIYAIFY